VSIYHDYSKEIPRIRPGTSFALRRSNATDDRIATSHKPPGGPHPPGRAEGTPAEQIGSTRGAGDEAFFRHVVAGMRNGVLAITRQAARSHSSTDEAYRPDL